MDRSLDSIGSCSLDVDADSTDISDTSGSLNFPTPISVKDVTREFTINIRERCSVHNFYQIDKDRMGPESKMVLKQPIGNTAASSALLNSGNPNSNKVISLTDASPDKKPSYLNLACCVNGYSNLTTYDSKIRQDINKSREVSPIRPSSSSIQYCKKNNSLAPPVLLQMAGGNGDIATNKQTTTNGQCDTILSNRQEGNVATHTENCDSLQENHRNTSFIQQRVERLYGPAALARGFYSPKKARNSSFENTAAGGQEDVVTSELTRKFQQLTPSKDYTEFRKKLSASTSNSSRQGFPATETNSNNSTVDLPVLRHLSQEFRAQLPIISPKRNPSINSPNKDLSPDNESAIISENVEIIIDEVDRKVVSAEINEITHGNSVNGVIVNEDALAKLKSDDGIIEISQKDGKYFLNLLKVEQTRILALADEAEKYVADLSENPDVPEDTLGFLRSAYGKARLLVSQKMKQFEGLCQNNLNSSPQDKFPTTVDDLQGFWDMVNLQVDHINLIFAEIDVLKRNDWKRPIETLARESSKTTKSQQKSNKTVNQKTKTCASNMSQPQLNSATLSAAALKRETQRKLLQEIKRKNKIAMSAKSASLTSSGESNAVDESTVEIFA